MAIPAGVGIININSQNTNASLGVGQNQMPGWSSHRKTNNGFGIQAGMFANTANWTLIADPDVNDGNIIDPDFIPSAQGQTI
ncbi:hypothetical protein [Peribacillus kribbensis]|uniref:hypothetical protein n=1 Tax=Peribacillus kribbensis TaxID=356658 RepID=UPI000421589B|nr:hypothetical protein [Peribacillus kribbensis]